MRLSVVVPCFNEERGIERLYQALADVLPGITDEFEVLLIDDGSRDGTLAAMRGVCSADPHFRYLALSRNFGKEAAMLAGLSQARGDAVAIMDADLQHPPALLHSMVSLLDHGYDQVVARRNRDGEPMLRKLLSRMYYRMINRVADVELEDGVGDFRVLSGRAVRALLTLGEYNRFSKGLFSWIGFDTGVVDYVNVGRSAGSSKWTLGRLVNYGIDGLVSFNNRLLRMAIYLGGLVTLVTFCYAASVLYHTIRDGVDVPGYATIVCSILGFGGLQLLFLGVIGEYLGRIYYETKRRPHFLVKEASGPGEAPVTVALGPGSAEHFVDAAAHFVTAPADREPTAGAPGPSQNGHAPAVEPTLAGAENAPPARRR